ncbi:MAG: carnitine 3-dehydrogenase [Pseudomonadota bacterium]
MTEVRQAAIIGGGVIGGGWLARLIAHGVPVRVFDPDPYAERKLQAVLEAAARAQAKLTAAPWPEAAAWQLCGSVAEAADGADLIVEAVPERLEIKRRVYAEIETANQVGVIASSTSGIMPSDLQAEMVEPGRLIVAHPFNPVYLLPLVELVAGKRTDPARIDWAKAFYARIGMHPLHCRVEIEGFLSDRLQEALWREALWLLHDNVATSEEIDAAIAYGPGLRWAQMGTMQTFHLAGGEGGIRAMLAMFGPCLKWPWTKLMEVPELTPDFIDRVGDQCEDQAGGLSPRALERTRDDNLVAILQALKGTNWGAGRTLAALEARLYDQVGANEAPDVSQPFETAARVVPGDWCDYNGHMNESRYGQMFSDAADGTMRLIGADEAYIGRGLSYFTVEIHIQFLDEARLGDAVRTTTQVLEGAGKKMRLFHALWHSDGRLLATGEQMLIHVSLETRRACEPEADVARRLSAIVEAQAELPMPNGAGRGIGSAR